jgi:tropomyosin
LEKLRIDGEEANARAEKAEALVKTLNDAQVKHENTIQTLNNKLKLLQADLDRVAPTDVKSLNETIQSHETSIQNLNNKIKLLQTELQRNEQRAEQVF